MLFSLTNKNTHNFTSNTQLENTLNFYAGRFTLCTSKIDVNQLAAFVPLEHWWNWPQSFQTKLWEDHISKKKCSLGHILLEKVFVARNLHENLSKYVEFDQNL